MKTRFRRVLIAAFAAVLTMAMLQLSAFAEEGDAPNTTDTQAKRTIMLYDCGADLETDAGLATYNLMQILESRFSSDDDITFLVMTGGSHKWQIDESKLVFPDGVALPEDAVVEYDPAKRKYADDPSDPKSQVSNVYNQIWEARGIDAVPADGTSDANAGKLVLLDGNGITGAEGEAVKSKDELMSDPDTLKAFINYGAANYPADKYDLILWDHDGGPSGGFGVDEHRDDSDDWLAPGTMSFSAIVEALADNAVTNSDADGDGVMDKFDFIDFDACLMNSVELALVMLEFSPADDHGITSFYYMNTDAGPVQVDPRDLTREITVMPVIVIKQMFGSDLYVPISRSPFTISAGNADSISLDYMDIGDIGDIGDTDGDGEVLDSAATITDIYGYQIVVTDRIQIKKARIRPAVYTGEELEPELVYHGKTLRPGIDYI